MAVIDRLRHESRVHPDTKAVEQVLTDRRTEVGAELRTVTAAVAIGRDTRILKTHGEGGSRLVALLVLKVIRIGVLNQRGSAGDELVRLRSGCAFKLNRAGQQRIGNRWRRPLPICR